MTDHPATATDAFHQLAGDVLGELLERHPESATALGDHRYDDRLDDQSPAAQADELDWAARRLADLDRVDPVELHPADQVDADILRNALQARRFELERAARDRVGPARSPTRARPSTRCWPATSRRSVTGCARWPVGWPPCRSG